jgi:hypothetical protein
LNYVLDWFRHRLGPNRKLVTQAARTMRHIPNGPRQLKREFILAKLAR